MLDLSLPDHRQLFMSKTHEPELTEVLHRIARPGDVFVDIGANIGWHTLSLVAARPDVRFAYAFEPSGPAFQFLSKGIDANECQTRCQALRVALSNAKARAPLRVFPELGWMHSSLFPLADYRYEEEQVDVDTLDSCARGFLAPPTLVKCDVEGGERNILLGAKDLLSGKIGAPPLWLMEANYETAGMAGFFPWDLIEIARASAAYEGYFIRGGLVQKLPSRTSLRHGDTLILAIPELHGHRFP
jgi:FkbM family methyltransferase